MDRWQRFESKFVRQDGGCWLWSASCDADGYGRFWSGEKTQRAHLFSYEMYVGPITQDMTIDHTCHNDSSCSGGPTCLHRRCVNPVHLEQVTRSENVKRGKSGARQRAVTHCPQGHPYDEGNTYVLPSRPNARYCRACNIGRTIERRRLTQALDIMELL